MTEEQYNMHRAADARAIARLNPVAPDIGPEPAPTEDELLAMDLAERQEHRQARIDRKLGKPTTDEIKARQRWHRHVSMLKKIHVELAPREHALKVARRDLFSELFTIPVRQQ